jgi:DNA gyrase subunit A
MKLTEKTGEVVSVMPVEDDDEIMLMSNHGMVVRTGVSGIRIIGRATQGVRAIGLKDDDVVAAVARVISSKKAEKEVDESSEKKENKESKDKPEETEENEE